MTFLLPYYHPKDSIVHAINPDAKIAFVAVVLVACWLGVYGLPLMLGYGLLFGFLALSFVGLAIATNVRGALRVFLLPAVVAITWIMLYLGVETYHLSRHLAGAAVDPVGGSLAGHFFLRLAFGLRRVTALFCSAAAVAAFVVSTSAADLRRARLVPSSMVMNVELFMSMFTRFQWRVRRILYGHQLVGYGFSIGGAFRRGPSNALFLASQGLVVFTIAVMRDIPSIFNYREVKKRLDAGRSEPRAKSPEPQA